MFLQYVFTIINVLILKIYNKYNDKNTGGCYRYKCIDK